MITYPENEQAKLAAVNELMKKFEQKIGSERFVSDGFYPGYFSQQHKVLFIGREGYILNGNNYIEDSYQAYIRNSFEDGKPVSKNLFHKRLLQYAYCFRHVFPPLEEVPTSADMEGKFIPEGMSFAFMNLSKVGGEAYRVTNWDELEKAVGRIGDLNKEEISLLEPEVIVTMHFMGLDWASQSLFDSCVLKHAERDIRVYRAILNRREIWVFDTWHFASLFKNERMDFYNQLGHAYRQRVIGSDAPDGDIIIREPEYQNTPKRSFITQLAEELWKKQKTITLEELAIQLDKNGFTTNTGKSYTRCVEAVRLLIVGAYTYNECVREDEKAAHIAYAFTRSDGRFAWE